MTRNVVNSIIYSQYLIGKFYDDVAMQINFKLSLDYMNEDGYRNLNILILSSEEERTVAIYAKVDWLLYGFKSSEDTIKNETPWVCYSYDTNYNIWGILDDILEEYSNRIINISPVNNEGTGWYKRVLLTEEQIEELTSIRKNSGYNSKDWKRVSSLEYHVG